MSRANRTLLVALFALAGGACMLGSLALPWFNIDAAHLQQAITSLIPALQTQLGGAASTFSANSPIFQTVLHHALIAAQSGLVGYRLFDVPAHSDVIAYGVVGVLTVWVAASILTRRTEVSQQPGQLIGLALLGVIRPVYALLNPPGSGHTTQFISNGPGLYVALGACVLLGLGAFIAMIPESKRADAPAAGYVAPPPKPVPGSGLSEQTHGAYAPVSAYVPGGQPSPLAPGNFPVGPPAPAPFRSGPAPGAGFQTGPPGMAGGSAMYPPPPAYAVPTLPAAPTAPPGQSVGTQPRGAYPKFAPGPDGHLPPNGPPAPVAPPLPPFSAPLQPPAPPRPGPPATARTLGDRSGSVPPPDDF